MRACQVCGCASWGPIGNLAELDRLGEFVPTVDAVFVCCDNCKAIARADLVQDAAPIAPPDAEFSGMGGFMKAAMPALGALLPPMSAPPTRTERLTIAVLRSDLDVLEVDTPQGIVALARALEASLDASAVPVLDPSAKQPWLVLSFPAREEFERWLTGMWDLINKSDGEDFTTTLDYPQKWWDVATSYALGK